MKFRLYFPKGINLEISKQYSPLNYFLFLNPTPEPQLLYFEFWTVLL
jgi:hypothetical protein